MKLRKSFPLSIRITRYFYHKTEKCITSVTQFRDFLQKHFFPDEHPQKSLHFLETLNVESYKIRIEIG
ncbi:hypothetical protein FZC70_15255 [Bacillus subtilis]|nr:hypothetical protein FZC70_15255 [Bacillus subtilis]